MAAIKLPNIIKKQPIAMVCALLCIGLGVAIYFLRDTLATAQATLDDKAAQGKHLKENVDSANSVKKADRLDEQYAAMTQAIQAIETRLVHASEVAINYQYFYKLESETQTKLTDLRQTGMATPAKNAAKTSYTGVVYAISVQGNYPQILDFLRRVENGEHYAHIVSLSLSHAGGGENAHSDTVLLSLNLNLELLGLP